MPAGAGGGGQPNMQALMRQAQKMQTDMAAAQEQLAAAQVDPEDVDTLVDLVLYAVQDAQTKAGQLTEQTMAPLSAGLGGMGGMPGLPF